jgi:hypothetical protein
VQVNITPDGRLQLVDGGTYFTPLSVAAVELLANAIPAAQSTIDNVSLSDALLSVAAGLSGGDGNATVTVNGQGVTVTASALSFADLANALGASPAPGATSFVVGPVTVLLMGA